jgi:hypothetical protein
LVLTAFLLNNGKAYRMAHMVGLAEWFAWSYFWPRRESWWMTSGWMYIGEPESLRSTRSIILVQ